VIYLQDCLQWQVEDIEQCLDYGLGIPHDVYAELDPACLLKMDSKTKADVAKVLASAGILSPNEGRAWFDMEPVEGGATPYLQQQNYSLAALSKRDALGPPPVDGSPSPAPPEETDPEDPTAEDDATDATANRILPSWQGVYDAAREYPKGCTTTHKRGLWLAKADVPVGSKPGKHPALWALVAGNGADIPGVEA
jgi:hypothetical protein